MIELSPIGAAFLSTFGSGGGELQQQQGVDAAVTKPMFLAFCDAVAALETFNGSAGPYSPRQQK